MHREGESAPLQKVRGCSKGARLLHQEAPQKGCACDRFLLLAAFLKVCICGRLILYDSACRTEIRHKMQRSRRALTICLSMPTFIARWKTNYGRYRSHLGRPRICEQPQSSPGRVYQAFPLCSHQSLGLSFGIYAKARNPLHGVSIHIGALLIVQKPLIYIPNVVQSICAGSTIGSK